MPADQLTSHERAALGNLGTTVDCRRVRLYRGGTGGLSAVLRSLVLRLSGDRAVALGNHVFLPDRCRGDLPALAHELTHCAQYQAWGPVQYYTRGLATQIRELLHRSLRIGSSPYRYVPEPSRPFHAYGMEQQGQIVEDCFRGDRAARGISPFRPGEEP